MHKYLAHYAERDILSLKSLIVTQPYDYVLVIPAYQEPLTFLNRVLNNINERLLVIVIINAPTHDNQTIALHQQLSDGQIWSNDYLTLSTFNAQKTINILSVDCCQKRLLPARYGVGLARKIGADLAAMLINNNTINTPWIFNTDADVTLPKDYFQATANSDNNVVLYPFSHHSDNAQLQHAANHYEHYLNAYVDGLKNAGSIYAYHSIGSCIAVHNDAYMQVRGFPKRRAGEDFYLLNKLRKLGPFTPLNKPLIHIEARYSQRVVFGTGPALTAITNNTWQRHYPPTAFNALKKWLTIINAPTAIDFINDSQLSNYAQLCGLAKARTHAHQHSDDAKTFARHMDNWFDALRTFKFIRHFSTR